MLFLFWATILLGFLHPAFWVGTVWTLMWACHNPRSLGDASGRWYLRFRQGVNDRIGPH